jgi:A/G-specific adenine glycosylase
MRADHARHTAGRALTAAAAGPSRAEPTPELAQRLVAWQRVHGRHALPWQQTRDPYRIWLSEIMLQQTQVSTVLGYYDRFLARFPDVAALAAAPLDEVLVMWQGLGYYSRARNLHRCAQAVVAEHGGVFPRSAAQLATLAGIGRSTAAAIAAFCFGERVAILDGNVKRVLTRALGFGDDLAQARHERALWTLAEAALPPADGIAAYTQGLMDLGSGLCTTRAPRCDACPWQSLCVAHREGRPEAYPVKTRTLRRGRRANALLWLQRPDGTSWLVQRPDTGVWAGLWALPEFDDLSALDAAIAEWPGEVETLPTIHHVLTHFDWALTPVRLRLAAQAELATSGLDHAAPQRWPSGRWVAPDQLAAHGLPAPLKKLFGG